MVNSSTATAYGSATMADGLSVTTASQLSATNIGTFANGLSTTSDRQLAATSIDAYTSYPSEINIGCSVNDSENADTSIGSLADDAANHASSAIGSHKNLSSVSSLQSMASYSQRTDNYQPPFSP